MAVPDRDRDAIRKELGEYPLPLDHQDPPTGELVLANGTSVSLGIPTTDSITHAYGALNTAKGVYITSHRQAFSYSRINNIPTSVNAAEQLLASYTERLRYTHGELRQQEIVKAEQTPSFRIKQSLIALAMFGEGNSVVSSDYDALDTFQGFERILKFVLPEEIGFQRLYVKIPELFIVGTAGMFPLEALSGGAAAIVDLAWQVFLSSKVYDDFTVLIDEPENHLHPSLQKRLLANMLIAFPSAQFVIATHSPLMINSVEDSSVYVMAPLSPGRYESRLLDLFDKSSSAQDTLYDVLGVDASAPVWAGRRFEEIVERYEGRLDEPEALEQMRSELKAAGLGDRITGVLQSFMERTRD